MSASSRSRAGVRVRTGTPGRLSVVIMRVEASPAVRSTLERLAAEKERLFGSMDAQWTVAHATERETSEVLKLSVSGADGIDAVFVKVLKPREPGPAARAVARGWVTSEFEVMSGLHRSLASFPNVRVARPLVCYPEQLAIVTAEVRGTPLSDLLERRATWWPSLDEQRELDRALFAVGGWLSVVGTVEAREGCLSLGDMRAYIDVRLRRLLEAHPPALDEARRTTVLRYFDRTAMEVDPADLRQVLTHADLAPSNVIVSGQEVSVIDFARAAPGGLFMDVTRLYTQLEFLTAKPKFRPAVVRSLQAALLRGFDESLDPQRPLFRLFVLQHLLCHMSNIARNPAPLLARLYNRHQLVLRQRWLQTFAA